MLIHQDPNIIYASTCTQANCTDPDFAANRGCVWDGPTNGCYFANADYGHNSTIKGCLNGVIGAVDGGGNITACASGFAYRSDYLAGQAFYWGSTNTVTWGKFQYDISTIPFVVGDHYVVSYYYKGRTTMNQSLRSQIFYSPGSGSCTWQSSIPYYPCATYIPPWSDYQQPTVLVGGFNQNCVDYNAGGFINGPLASACLCLYWKNAPAAQTACWGSAGETFALPDGLYNEWSYHSAFVNYTADIDANEDPMTGNRLLKYALTFGYSYSGTGPFGTDFYIDDLNFQHCVNQ